MGQRGRRVEIAALTVDPVIGTAVSPLDPIGAIQASGGRIGRRWTAEAAMNPPQRSDKPVLFVDVDGVISLFGFPSGRPPAGSWVSVDGLPHLISATAGEHLLELARMFELVWCTGWEERADEHLPHLLRLPDRPPFLTFGVPTGTRHWKLQSIERHAGERPLAWIDDGFDDSCRAWAAARRAPTLLVATDPAVGLAEGHLRHLEEWAQGLA
jgi:hypothetical protein